MNTFGNNLTLTTFGESHGPAMGGIIDGFPAGFRLDFDKINEEVAKRRPGSSSLVSARNEKDIPEFLSGVLPDGTTLGTPIGFIVRNTDQRSQDYSTISDLYRPSHADYTYDARYGIRDPRGGGRSSARETVNWVVAGALASQWLEKNGITIQSALTGVGPIESDSALEKLMKDPSADIHLVVEDSLRRAMEEHIRECRNNGDTVGGRVSCLINGVPAGVGNPVANKLQAALASAMMSINAAKGFEYGLGFRSSSAHGSVVNDPFIPSSDHSGYLKTATNFSGGIQGGITNGMPIFFSVYFKPTPTIMRAQSTVDKEGNPCVLNPAGRHDPCVAVRAVPIVKAMASLVLADFLIR